MYTDISIKFKKICFVYGIEISNYPIPLDWRHMIIRAFLDIYICDVHRKFLNDQSRRQIEYLIVFNIFTVCVLYEI